MSFRPTLPITRRLGGLAAATLLAGLTLVPGAEAAPARNHAPPPYVAQVLTTRSGASFIPSRVGNPINARGLVAGSTPVGDKSRAAVFNLQTRSMRVLGAFPADSTLANDINASGEVAAERRRSDGTSEALAWSLRTGVVTRLTAPGATQSTTSAINDRGVVVGSIDTPARPYGMVWNLRNGHRFTLDMDEAVGINSSGVVVGFRGELGPTTRYHALMWSPATSRVDELPPLSDDDSAMPTDINRAGLVTGQSYSLERDDLVLRPVVWRAAHTAPCRLTGAVGNNLAGAINDRGQVVGVEVSYADNAHRSVLWNACGQSGRTLPWPNDSYALPYGINASGEIVGFSGADGILWTRSGRP